jgi:hypothetical protein
MPHTAAGAHVASAPGPFATDSDGGDPRVADVRRRLNGAWSASQTAPEKAQAKLDKQGKI